MEYTDYIVFHTQFFNDNLISHKNLPILLLKKSSLENRRIYNLDYIVSNTKKLSVPLKRVIKCDGLPLIGP